MGKNEVYAVMIQRPSMKKYYKYLHGLYTTYAMAHRALYQEFFRFGDTTDWITNIQMVKDDDDDDKISYYFLELKTGDSYEISLCDIYEDNHSIDQEQQDEQQEEQQDEQQEEHKEEPQEKEHEFQDTYDINDEEYVKDGEEYTTSLYTWYVYGLLFAQGNINVRELQNEKKMTLIKTRRYGITRLCKKITSWLDATDVEEYSVIDDDTDDIVFYDVTVRKYIKRVFFVKKTSTGSTVEYKTYLQNNLNPEFYRGAMEMWFASSGSVPMYDGRWLYYTVKPEFRIQCRPHDLLKAYKVAEQRKLPIQSDFYMWLLQTNIF